MIGRIVRFLIGHADAELTETVFDAAYRRKSELYPEWEIVYIALPKKDRKNGVNIWNGCLVWNLRNEDVQ